MLVEGGTQTILVPEEWEGPVGGRSRVVLSARAARIRDHDGQISGVVIVIDDRTDLVLIEEARQAESAEQQRMRALLSRYLAPRVLEQLLSSSGDLELGGSRRNVSVLFADVRGFTGFSASREPEDVVAMLNQYLALATVEVFGELGTIDKFLGDGVMAIFGAPLALEDHPMAAVRAALRMRSRLDELRRATGVHVGFGIGINSGDAIVGNIGTAQFMSYTAIGDVVNVAARLQAEARSGEILISETTVDGLAGRALIEDLGGLYVKGRPEPVATHKLLGLAESESPSG
jgi:adenylate cyclase